jgi:hypothetical protein
MTRVQYYLYDGLPVKMEETPEGALRVQVFDLTLGRLRRDMSYRSLILHDRNNLAHAVSPSDFDHALAQLSQHRQRAQLQIRRAD